jgi:anti-anti-sigma factor
MVSDQSSLPSQALTFTTRWEEPAHAVISVHGEIDAANADTFLDGALTKLVLCRTLSLDLTNVEFFSSAGYSALCILAQRCATADVEMTVTTSTCVRRVIEICGGAQGFVIAGPVPAESSPV